MARAPLLVAAVLAASGTAWALALAADPGPWAAGAAALIAADLLLLTMVVIAGMVLSRGRWAGRLAGGLVAAHVLLAVVLPVGGLWVVALSLTGLGVLGLAGPWMGGWLRRLPSATGPPARAVALMVGLLVLPGLIGASQWPGVGTWHIVLAVVSVGLAWAYGRALLPALWALRLGLPILAAATMAYSTAVGAGVIGAVVLGITVLAWTHEAYTAAIPLVPRTGTALPVIREDISK